MANIIQQAAPLNITGVINSPFSLQVNFTSITTSTGASVAWSQVTNPIATVIDTFGNVVATGIPSVTSPANNQLLVSWTAAQTTAISNSQRTRWSLEATIASVAAQPLLGGTLTFVPSTFPAASTSTSANLSVQIGTNNANLTVSTGGPNGVGAITSNNSTVFITNPNGPSTDLSVVQPQVTVSSIGTSTAGVTLANNGANYGPDTHGTTTMGLQEALTALQSTGGRILLLNGDFDQGTTPLTYLSSCPLLIEGQVPGVNADPGEGLGRGGVFLFSEQLSSGQYSLTCGVPTGEANTGYVELKNLTFRGQGPAVTFNVNVSTSTKTWTWATGSGAASLITAALIGLTVTGTGVAGSTTITAVNPGVSITVNNFGTANAVETVTTATTGSGSTNGSYGVGFYNSAGLGLGPGVVFDSVQFDHITNPLYIDHQGNGPIWGSGNLGFDFCNTTNVGGGGLAAVGYGMMVLNCATAWFNHIESFNPGYNAAGIVCIWQSPGSIDAFNPTYVHIGNIYNYAGTLINLGGAQAIPYLGAILDIDSIYQHDNGGESGNTADLVRVDSGSGSGTTSTGLQLNVGDLVWGTLDASGGDSPNGNLLHLNTGVGLGGPVQMYVKKFFGGVSRWVNNASAASVGVSSFLVIDRAYLRAAPTNADVATSNLLVSVYEAPGGSTFRNQLVAGTIIGQTFYNPAIMATYSLTSTSDADVDATNLVVSFIAPWSGQVVIDLESYMATGSGPVVYWLLRSASSTVSGTNCQISQNNVGATYRSRVRVTGLTPGTTYTYKWGYRVTSSGANMYIGDDGSSNRAGPASMIVMAA